jgi:hypothetical protein
MDREVTAADISLEFSSLVFQLQYQMNLHVRSLDIKCHVYAAAAAENEQSIKRLNLITLHYQ